MPELVIPLDFNSWPKEKQIRHYLDIGWHIQPVYPPDHPIAGKVTSPGKQPRLTLEQRLQWTPDDVIKHFREHPTDNVGLIPMAPHIAIDLDDGGDGGSLKFFESKFPELFAHPKTISRRGPHLHGYCSDVPDGIGNPKRPNFIPDLSAELFTAPFGNIILPPSIHPETKKPYRWDPPGVFPVWPWSKLEGIFKFQANGASASKEHRSGEWKRKYRGNLRTLNLVGLCQRLGIYGAPLGGDDYKHSIQCPWRGEHTDKGENWHPNKSETVIWVQPGSIPAFKCQHAHCAERSIEHLLERAEACEPCIVDRFCARQWRDPLDPEFEVEEECPYEPVDWSKIPQCDTASGPKFAQAAIYPRDSILGDYMQVASEVCEGAACWSLATILSVVAALLGRRVYYPRTDKNVYLNLFLFLVGPPGYRKTTALKIGERIAYTCLPASAFLPARCSVEALFDQYYEGVGGRPDKLWLVEEANVVMSTWTKTQYGECVAAEMLRLYDCCRLIEAFNRNKKKSDTKSLREVPETSTSALFSGTFSTAALPVAHVKEGLARRFQFYVSEVPEQIIVWPQSSSIQHLINAFKPLLRLERRLSFLDDQAASNFWSHYQHENRKLLSEINRDDDALGARLSTAPDNVLKVAGLFEACRAVRAGETSLSCVSLASLELATEHVEENLRGAAFLDKYGKHKSLKERDEILLALIRGEFSAQRPNTIYATRSELTRKFCANTRRMGALRTEELYLDIIPKLIQQGEAVRVMKQGKLEVYAFRQQDHDDSAPTSSETSTNSTGGFTNAPNAYAGVYAHKNVNSTKSTGTRIDKEVIGDIEVNPPVENAEFSEGAPVSGASATITKTNIDQASIVHSQADLERVWYELNASDAALALDLETYGNRSADALQPHRGDVRLISLALENEAPVVIDLRALGEGSPDWAALFHDRELLGHNLQFDLRWLEAKFGVRGRQLFCTYAAARLLSNGDRQLRNDLGAVLERHLKVHLEKSYGTSDWGALMLTDAQFQYAADDVRYLHRLRNQLAQELVQTKLDALFQLEMELLPVTVSMERAGFAIDRQKLEAIRDLAKGESKQGPLRELRELFGLANFDSPEQVLAKFKGLGVELPDTNEDTLKRCDHPGARLLLDYRALEMQRRQAETLLAEVASDGRIHAEFLPLGTDTGRFSSRQPNLQNINRSRLREAFVAASTDRRLVVADYSQIELRAAAYLAPDQTMLKALREGRDLHAATAAVVLGKKVSEVTGADRQLAKAVNFGLLYGQSAEGLVTYAQTSYGVKLSAEEATSVRTRFFKHYKGLKTWHQRAWDNVAGITEGRTLLGRRRLLGHGATDWNRFQVQVNFPVTGACADGLKLAMIRLARELPADAQMAATVHDELIVDCPSRIAPGIKMLMVAVMQEEMAKIFPDLPIRVDAKICNRWSEK
jgi:DNA polymerase-1